MHQQQEYLGSRYCLQATSHQRDQAIFQNNTLNTLVSSCIISKLSKHDAMMLVLALNDHECSRPALIKTIDLVQFHKVS